MCDYVADGIAGSLLLSVQNSADDGVFFGLRCKADIRSPLIFRSNFYVTNIITYDMMKTI